VMEKLGGQSRLELRHDLLEPALGAIHFATG
jgi:hypothetical protein